MHFAHVYRASAGAIAVAALVLQFALLVERFNGDLGAATLRFFNYFTLLSNSVGAAAFLAPVLAPSAWIGRYFSRVSVRTAVTVYLIVVAAVYHALLASRWDPNGWQLVVDIALHTIVPAAMILDWLFLTPKRDISTAFVPKSVLFPLCYSIWALGIGALTGFYPYPFLDAAALGYPRLGANLVILLGLFATLGLLLAALGRRLAESAAAQK